MNLTSIEYIRFFSVENSILGYQIELPRMVVYLLILDIVRIE